MSVAESSINTEAGNFRHVPPPIVLVTGANSGVGLGICKRLLVQLCDANPSDALPQPFSSFHPEFKPKFANPKRTFPPTEDPWNDIPGFHVGRVQEGPDREAAKRAKNVRDNVKIEIEYVDLAMVDTIFKFGQLAKTKYPYISHLICNAGVASFAGMNWILCIRQLMLAPMAALTAPAFYTQHRGERSVDGLGWVWQSNYRRILPLLKACKHPLGPRVVWMSSLEASPEHFDQYDTQLLQTDHSYEAAKYQIDLISHGWVESDDTKIRHFVAHPGVCSTNISSALVGPVMDLLKVLMFYVARMFGSQNHTISPYTAAIAAVHLALAPLVFLSVPPRIQKKAPENPCLSCQSRVQQKVKRPHVRYGSATDAWGNPHVQLSPIKQYTAHAEMGRALLSKCEDRYLEVARERASPK
ncbi:hypothetical protein BD779DRAFT_1539940 [Infundibulicybe gibba]|nr:hypothetical protein BD779DRAFT_1539940 [Infundibulicybe gibba]